MNMQAGNYSDIVGNRSDDVTNQNISSVLSQIQDDGPAYAGAKNRDNLVSFQSESRRAAVTGDAQKKEKHDDDVPHSSKEPASDEKTETGLKGERGDSMSSRPTEKKGRGIKFLLVLFIIIGMTFFLYELDVRTNKLEMMLSEYDIDMQDTVDTYSDIPPKIVQMNETLKSVKNEIELIKSNKIERVLPDKKVPEENTVTDDRTIDTLKKEIVKLKSELILANDKLGQKVDVSTTDSVVEKIIPEKKVVSWKVNLASLSNKNKAEEIVNRLKTDGFSASIKEARVKGKRVYRLSVDGFSELEQAELFILIADEEYGLKGGWVRKVNNK